VRILCKPALKGTLLLAQLKPGCLSLAVGSGRGEEPWPLLNQRNASQKGAVGLAFDLFHALEGDVTVT
jgi:hypothetical protein